MTHKEVNVYIPLDKGLQFGDIINICRDPKNPCILLGICPLKISGPLTFELRTKDDVYVMQINVPAQVTVLAGLSDDWNSWETNQSRATTRMHVVPMGKNHEHTRRMYRGYICRGHIKCTTKHNMPLEMANAMAGAFRRAGLGKPT